MDSALWTAVVAVASIAITSILSPWILARQLNKNAAEVKAIDRKREDEVAGRLQERQDATAAETTRVADLLAATTTETNVKLDTIHVLVNSNMTESKVAELGATKRMLVLMLELASRKRSGGIDPNPDAAGEITAAKRRIAELEAELTERRKQTALVSNAAPV